LYSEHINPASEGNRVTNPKLLDELTRSGRVGEAVVLSTCNRVEVYAVVEAFHGGLADVSGVLARHTGMDVGSLSSYLYVHYAASAVEHLFSVAAGPLLNNGVTAQITFRNLVGFLEGHDLEGKTLFDSSSGDVSVARVRGEIKADTGSGDVKASGLEGSFICDTGSGNCDLGDFKGDTLRWGAGPHEELGFAFRDLGSDPENRVIIRTGTGDAFIEEVDAGNLGQRLPASSITPRVWDHIYWDAKRLLMNLLDIEAPMIPAVNGPVLIHAELADGAGLGSERGERGYHVPDVGEAPRLGSVAKHRNRLAREGLSDKSWQHHPVPARLSRSYRIE